MSQDCLNKHQLNPYQQITEYCFLPEENSTTNAFYHVVSQFGIFFGFASGDRTLKWLVWPIIWPNDNSNSNYMWNCSHNLNHFHRPTKLELCWYPCIFIESSCVNLSAVASTGWCVLLLIDFVSEWWQTAGFGGWEVLQAVFNGHRSQQPATQKGQPSAVPEVLLLPQRCTLKQCFLWLWSMNSSYDGGV